MAFFAKVFVSLLVRLPRILKSFFDHGIWRLIRPFTQIPVEPPYIKDPMAYQKKVDHDILFCYYCCSI